MNCLRYVYRISCRFGEVSKWHALDVAAVYLHLDFISMKRDFRLSSRTASGRL